MNNWPGPNDLPPPRTPGGASPPDLVEQVYGAAPLVTALFAELDRRLREATGNTVLPLPGDTRSALETVLGDALMRRDALRAHLSQSRPRTKGRPSVAADLVASALLFLEMGYAKARVVEWLAIERERSRKRARRGSNASEQTTSEPRAPTESELRAARTQLHRALGIQTHT